MKKLHRVSYSELFGVAFQPEKIDENLRGLQIEEKLYLLDNIIDYLYYNFKLLRVNEEENKESAPKRAMGLSK